MSNCINCFHYESCAGVDVTGYVTDREQEIDPCENFISREEVHPETGIEIEVKDYGSPIFQALSDAIFVTANCARCTKQLYINRYSRKEWDEYYKDHHSVEISHKYCPECGAKINLYLKGE